jgi:hypothetical protein
MSQYPKNWTERSVEKFVTQESQQKSRAEFEATHVPINRIKIERTQIDDWADKDDYITESDFYQAVIDSHQDADNRMFFVVGETGSGKSELCQWLKYNIEDEYKDCPDDDFQHEPILIPRHVREPREVLQRLTAYLEDTELDEARKLAELPADGVLDKTTGEITLAFEKADRETIRLLQSDRFKQEVRENLEKFVNSFDDPSQELEFEPISREKLESLIDSYSGVEQEIGTDSHSAIDVLYEKITKQAKDSIKDMLFVGDLKETLRQLNERFRDQNRRPVLIIEDLAGFTIFQHEILSFFSDLQAANWDVVIGVTTGMNQKLVKDRRADLTTEETINDRTEARVTLTQQTDEGSKTLFLQQEDIHIDLARKYLTAIKQDADVDFTPSLPISKSNLSEAFSEELYPFNEPFLTRVYENLQEDDQKKQTPRNYLKFVIEGLLTNESPPFEHADLLSKLGTIDSTISSEYQKPDRGLLKWYGERNEDGNKYVVDERIPEVFGIESDGWAPSVDNTLFCETCGTEMEETTEGTPYCPDCETMCSDCQVPMERNGEYWICTDDSDHKEPVGGLGELFKTRRQELLDWKADGVELKKTSLLEDGAERVIRYFHDNPTSLRTPPRNSQTAGSIWWDKGSRMVPIHVSNDDDPDYRKIIVSRDLPESLLIDLLRIGVYDDLSIDDHIDADRVDPQALRWWADKAVSDLRSSVEEDIEEGFSVTLDEVALFGKYLLKVLNGNGTEFSAEALARPLGEGQPDANKIYSPSVLDLDKYKIGTHRETLKGLFRARFHLRSSMVNYPKLQSHINQTSPEELVDKMAEISGGDDGVKIGETKSNAEKFKFFLTFPNSLNVRTIARNIQNFRAESSSSDLKRLKSELLSEHREVTEAFRSVSTTDDIDFEAIDKAYNVSDTSRPRVVQNVRQLDDEDLERTVRGLRTQMDRLEKATNAWELLDIYRPLRRLTRTGTTKRVYEPLSELLSELQSLEKSLEQTKQGLEAEEFGVDLPDITPFDEAQAAANSIESAIEGGL